MAPDGKVVIETKLESDGLTKDAQKMESALISQMQQLVDKIDKLFSSMQPEVDAKINADIAPAEAGIKSVEGIASELDPETKVHADTNPAEDEIKGLERAAESMRPEIPVDSNTDLAEKETERFRDKTEKKETKLPVKIDEAKLDKQFDKLKSDIEKLAKAAAAAFAAVGVAIGVAMKSAIDTGMAFEAQMSRVKAISGATKDEFQALNEQAKKLGADTAFSATEAAAGMENLASAGFEANEIMAAMPGLLDLAAVSGGDVAAAAEAASTALRAFGLDASEAGHVADVFAKAAADTNAEALDMGEAMKYVAPVAKAMGLSIEETAAAIGIMSDAGIKGSQAGTTLRSALSRLAKPTDVMAKTMSKLGVSFYDTNGKLLPLKDQVSMLEEAFIGLSDEEKNNALVTIYGQEALSGMLSLIDAGPDKLDGLTTSLKSADGAAAEFAAVMKDNLSGDVEELGGALETLGIKIFEAFNDPLREAAQAAEEAIGQLSSALDTPEMQAALQTLAEGISGLVQGFAEFAADAIPKLVDGLAWVIENFGGFASMARGAGAAFVAFKTAAAIETVVGKATNAINGAGGALKALSGLLSANPWAIAAAGITTIVAAAAQLEKAMHEASDEAKAFAKEADLLVEAGKKLHDEASKASDAYFDQGQAMRDNAENARGLVAELQALQLETELSSDQQKRQRDIINELNDIYPSLNLAIDNQTGALTKSSKELAALIELEKSREKLDSAESRRAELYAEQEKQTAAQAEAKEKLREATAKLTQAEIDLENASFFGKGNAQADVDEYKAKVSSLELQYLDLGDDIELIGKQIVAAEGDIADANVAIEENTSALDGIAERYAAGAAQIAEANAEVIANADTVVESAGKLTYALQESESAFETGSRAIDARAEEYRRLSQEADRLAKTEGRTGAETAKMLSNIEQLNQAFPALNLSIDETTGALSSSVPEIDNWIGAWGESEKAALALEHMNNLVLDQANAAQGIDEVISALDSLGESYVSNVAAKSAYDGMIRGGIELTDEQRGAYDELTATIAKEKAQHDDLQATLSTLQEAQGLLTASYETAAEQRQAALEIVAIAERNGVAVTAESVEGILASKNRLSEEEKRIEAERAAAINKFTSDMQSAYESYAGKTQDLDSRIGQNRAISLKTMQRNLEENTRIMDAWAAEMDILAEKMSRGVISEAFLEEIRSMGPEALKTVQAMNKGAEEELTKTSEMYGTAGESAKNALSVELEAALGVSDVAAKAIANSLVTALESGEEVDEAAKTWIGKALDGAASSLSTDSTAMEGLAGAVDSGIATSLEKGTETPEAGKTLIANTQTGMVSEVTTQDFATNVGSPIDTDAAQGITDGTATEDAAKTLIADAKTAADVEVTTQDFPATGKNIDDGIAQGITANQSTVTSAAFGVASAGKLAADGIMNNTTGHIIGANFGQGMADGINSKSGAIAEAARSAAQAAYSAATSELDIHSPSRVMEWVGSMFGQGFADGIEGETSAVINAVTALTDEMIEGLTTEVDFLANVDYDKLQGMALSASMADQTKLAEIASGSTSNQYSSSNTTIHAPITVSLEGAQISNEMDLDYIADYVSHRIQRELAMLNRHKGVM